MEHKTNEESITLSRNEVSDLIAHMTYRLLIALGIVLIFAIVQIIRLGLGQKNLILVGGSILSGIAFIVEAAYWSSYAGEKRRGIIPMMIIAGSFLPYLFGCYLVFYEGFWRLRTLLDKFSMKTMLLGFFFVVVGYHIVKGVYLFSEFTRKVDKRIIIIDSKDSI